MGRIKIGAIPPDTLITPPKYATFYKENLEAILAGARCVGIRFFSAKVDYPLPETIQTQTYDTVIAIGFNANNENLIAGPIRWDNVPCPPECHYFNGMPGGHSPDVAIDMQAVQGARPDAIFAAQFSTADIQSLLGLLGLAKMRVYYSQTGTFLLQGADANGIAIVNVYGLGDTSDSSAPNLWE